MLFSPIKANPLPEFPSQSQSQYRRLNLWCLVVHVLRRHNLNISLHFNGSLYLHILRRHAPKQSVSLAELAYISVQNIYDTADSSRQIKYKFGKRLAGVWCDQIGTHTRHSQQEGYYIHRVPARQLKHQHVQTTRVNSIKSTNWPSRQGRN